MPRFPVTAASASMLTSAAEAQNPKLKKKNPVGAHLFSVIIPIAAPWCAPDATFERCDSRCSLLASGMPEAVPRTPAGVVTSRLRLARLRGERLPIAVPPTRPISAALRHPPKPDPFMVAVLAGQACSGGIRRCPRLAWLQAGKHIRPGDGISPFGFSGAVLASSFRSPRRLLARRLVPLEKLLSSAVSPVAGSARPRPFPRILARENNSCELWNSSRKFGKNSPENKPKNYCAASWRRVTFVVPPGKPQNAQELPSRESRYQPIREWGPP